MKWVNKLKSNIRFDRNELSGSFGDIGTDLPLIIGMIMVSGIDSASTLIIYGLLQILSGIYYGMPMAVQPLKAVATIVIAQHLTGNIIYGGGLAIGVIMLLFTVTGIINKLKSFIPKAVIRGIQLGLGLMLANIALKDYIVKDSHLFDYILVAIAGTIGIILMGNRKYPPAIFIILIGVFYALFFQIENPTSLFANVEIEIPNFSIPKWNDITTGFLLLALPQIPLSIGNSILATEQISKDLFPEKKITVNKIGFTYSLMNILSAFFSGIPVCHGSGGMVGHYSFGARTGGSIVIYGTFFLLIGFFFSANFDEIIQLFPMQILGVILFFEALKLVFLIKDLHAKPTDLYVALFVGLIACSLPYGFLISIILGTIIYYNASKIKLFNH
jgi:hypothetical protein